MQSKESSRARASRESSRGGPSPADGLLRSAVIWLPTIAAVLLAALTLTPRVQESRILVHSFWAAAAALFA